MYDIIELSNKSLDELYAIADGLKITKVKSYSKAEKQNQTASKKRCGFC